MEETQTIEIDIVSCIPMLRRYALKLARNGPDADDLVQDCLLRALPRQQQARGAPAWPIRQSRAL